MYVWNSQRPGTYINEKVSRYPTIESEWLWNLNPCYGYVTLRECQSPRSFRGKPLRDPCGYGRCSGIPGYGAHISRVHMKDGVGVPKSGLLPIPTGPSTQTAGFPGPRYEDLNYYWYQGQLSNIPTQTLL